VVVAAPPYSVSTGTVTVLAAVGDNGGSAFPDTDCPTDQVATVSHLRAGDNLDAFGLGCSTVAVVMP
jgi:hypothetical protein